MLLDGIPHICRGVQKEPGHNVDHEAREFK